MSAVVTGLGLATPFGVGAGRFFDAAMAGWGPSTVAADMEAVAAALAGESRRTLNRESEMLLVAAREALADAGIDPAAGGPEALGVAVATRHSGLQDYADLFWRGVHDGRPVSPALGPQTGINGPAANVSIRLGAGGPNATFAGGSVGGVEALAWALGAVERGDAPAMLACGVDVAPAVAAELLPPAGEAAVALVVESGAAAAARGGRPRGAIDGLATGFSARGDLAVAAERARRGALAAAAWPAGPVADRLGGPAGAGGLLQLAAGCLALKADGDRLLVHCRDGDAAAAVALRDPGAPR